MGGTQLEGEPLLAPGTRVRVQLIGHRQEQSITLAGTVLRVDGNIDREFVVAFDPLSADEEDAIEDVVLGRLCSQLKRQVLIATSSGAERVLLARSLVRLGYQVLEADSPLDVVALLADPDTRPDAILLGTQFSGGGGLELATFLADAYPRVRRILVGRDSIRMRRQAAGIVHAILARPWTEPVLAQVLEPER